MRKLAKVEDAHPQEELLNKPDVAQWLGVSVGAVDGYRREEEGGLPFVQVGRAVKFRRNDVEAWLEKRTTNGLNGRVKAGRRKPR
jgi:excisionase family DNA binding protein